MPRLGDLVGSLMAEFTLARVRADLESVKLVELYRKEGLLEGASVPRFRMPDVTVDLPLLVSDLEGADGASSYARPSAADVREAVREAAASSKLLLDGDAEDAMVKHLDSGLEQAWKVPKALDAALSATRELSLGLDPVLRKRILSKPTEPGIASAPGLGMRKLDSTASAAEVDAEAKAFQRSVELRLKSKAIGAMGQGPRFVMSAKTSEIREAGDPSHVARVSMTFKEDGFEVVSIENGEGRPQVRLVPE